MGTGDKGYREKRRKIALVAANSQVAKGMIRFLYVVLDLSQAVNEEDMRPSRLAVISALMYRFFREFFSQNPLSQLGLVVTRNGIAERLTGWSQHSHSNLTFRQSRNTKHAERETPFFYLTPRRAER